MIYIIENLLSKILNIKVMIFCCSCILISCSVVAQPIIVNNGLSSKGFHKLISEIQPSLVSISVENKFKTEISTQKRHIVNHQTKHPGFFEYLFRLFKSLFTTNKLADSDIGESVSISDVATGPQTTFRDSSIKGTGVFISNDGYIVTSAHLFKDDSKINVIMDDNTLVPAELIGWELRSNIAVLKVNVADPTPYLSFADEGEVNVGDWAVGVSRRVHEKIYVVLGVVAEQSNIALLDKEKDSYLKVNAFNSYDDGGLILNSEGKIIGLSPFVTSWTNQNSSDMFATPSTLASKIAGTLIYNKKNMVSWVDVQVRNIGREEAVKLGLMVDKAVKVKCYVNKKNNPLSSLKVGDIILSINDYPIDSTTSLYMVMNKISLFEPTTVTVWRDGAIHKLVLQAVRKDAKQPDPLNLKDNLLYDKYKIKGGSLQQGEGVMISVVDRGEDRKGDRLRQGDIILSIERKKVNSVAELFGRLEYYKEAKKQEVSLLIKREDKKLTITFPLLLISDK